MRYECMHADRVTRCPRCQRRFPASGECESHGRPTALVDVAETAQPPAVVAPAGWRLAGHIATGGMAHVFALDRGSVQAAGVLKWGRYRERDIHARFDFEAEVLRAVGPPAAPTFYEHGQIDQ